VKKTVITILLFLIAIKAVPQDNPLGIVPDIVNYPPSVTEGSEQNWAIVQDKRGIMYFGNDEKGVLEYDGINWKTYQMPNKSIVRSLACSEDGVVYVGAVSEIGFLAPDSVGSLHYESLVPKLDSSHQRFFDVWKTYCEGDRVYFHSEKYVFTYFPAKDSISVLTNDRHVLFGFNVNGNFYCGNFPRGLLVLQGDTIMTEAKGGEYYMNRDIFGLTRYDDSHLLIGVSNYGLSLYNTETGEVDSSFASHETNQYLNENFLTQLITLSDGKFVASTINGGICVINHDGTLSETISNEQGLQNKTIYSSYEETIHYPFPHLWTAMSFGISKISLSNPLRKFEETSGYEGLINTINELDDRLFIGTVNGLYISTGTNNPYFRKVEGISRTCWDLEKIRLENGEEILLAISLDGLRQVNRYGQALDLTNRIGGVDEEEKKVFWGFSIYTDPFNANLVFLGLESSINAIRYVNGNWNLDMTLDSLDGEIRSLARSRNGKLWFGSKLAGVGCLKTIDKSAKDYYYGVAEGLPTKENNSVYEINGEVYVGTENGIYRIYDQGDSISFYRDSLLNSYLPGGSNHILYMYNYDRNSLWISYNNEFTGWSIALLTRDNPDSTFVPTSKPFTGLDDFSTDAVFSSAGKDAWFSLAKTLYHYNPDGTFTEGSFNALIRKVIAGENHVLFDGTFAQPDKKGKLKISLRQHPDMIPEIKFSDNNIEFLFCAPYFEKEEDIEFSYFLEGFSKDWSAWERKFERPFTNLSQGRYTFMVKARNAYGDESDIAEYSFIILRPWYLSFLAILGYIIVTFFIIYTIIILYTRRLKKENIRLEGIIQERTAEIRKQKEELTDSIEYASRIQRALLPPDKMLSRHGLEHFILFRPRDIVSGDFYWFGTNDGKVFVVAADCTGHGVPGAFMSMLGISFLDEIVIKSGVSETNLILDALRNHVITSLRQTGKGMEESTKDGMDLSMVSIDEETRIVQYSGAYNPMYAVRPLNKKEKEIIAKNGELDADRNTLYNDTHILYQVKADQMPIGISEKDYNFTAHQIEDKEATIYLFSDGYLDQFGGPSGKKFMSKNFKKLLLDIQHLNMEQQLKTLEKTLLEWMGNISQIDDILVIGINLSK